MTGELNAVDPLTLMLGITKNESFSAGLLTLVESILDSFSSLLKSSSFRCWTSVFTSMVLDAKEKIHIYNRLRKVIFKNTKIYSR